MSGLKLSNEAPYYQYIPKMNKDLPRYITSAQRYLKTQQKSEYEARKRIPEDDDSSIRIPNYQVNPYIKPSLSYTRRDLSDNNSSHNEAHISSSSEDILCGSDFSNFKSKISNIEAYIKNNSQMIIEAPFKINAFALTKNRKYLIYGTTNGNIALFDTQKRLIKNDVPLTTHSIFNILITQDESYIIACGQGITIKVYNYPSLSLHTELQGHTDNVMRLIQSADGFWLYSCSEDGTVRSWNLKDFTPGKILMTHSGKCKAICLSPDERYLFSGGEDKDVRVYDMIRNRQVTQLAGHLNWVWALAVSPDSKMLASGSSDNTIKLWKMSSFECIVTLRGHAKRLSVLQFSPDNRFLVSASTDHTLRVWKMDKLKNYPYKVLLGHDNWVKAMMINPDQKKIYSAGEDRTFRIWSFPTEIEDEIVVMDEKPITCFAISKNMKYLAYAADIDVIKIWDIKANRVYYCRKLPAKINACSFSPDHNWLIIALDNGSLHAYDFIKESYSFINNAHVDTIKCLQFSSSGDLLLTGGNDTRIGVWEFPSFTLKYYIRGHSSAILSLAISSNNSFIISSSTDNKLKYWKCSNGKCKSTFEVHIIRLALLKSQDIVITGNTIGTISLTNLKTQAIETEFKSHKVGIVGLYVTSDETHLISCDEAGVINLWNLTYRQHLTSIANNAVSDMQVSSDEMYLFLSEAEKLRKIKNPLKDGKMNVYGPLPARNFISYMNDLIVEKKKVPYDKNYDEFIITPYRITPVHLYAYYGLKNYLQNSLDSKFRLNKTADHHTALSISLYRADSEITEIILRKLCEEMKENRYLAGTLENCIIMLNSQGNPILHELYSGLMIVSPHTMPRYASSNHKYPIYYFSDKLDIDKSSFITTTEKENEDKVVLFQQSTIRQDYNMGSIESINFLNSILSSPNESLFTTPFIRHILYYKWTQCKPLLNKQAIRHFGLMGYFVICNLMYYLSESLEYVSWFNSCMLIIYTLESIRSSSGLYKLTEYGKIAMLGVYLITMLSRNNDQMYGMFIGICFIMNVQGLYYLQTYDTTRYITELLRSVIKETEHIFLAVIYLAFWYLYLNLDILHPNENHSTLSIRQVINLILGGISIISLYFILSKFQYIYEKVQFRRSITDLKQVCRLILDIEQSIIPVSDTPNKSYLQVCDTPPSPPNIIPEGTLSKVNTNLQHLGDFVMKDQNHILQRVQNIEKMVQVLYDARPKEEAKQNS
jgi:WD40 repeat protein